MSVVHIARTMQVALRIAEEVGRCRVDLQEDRKEAKKAERDRKADEEAKQQEEAAQRQAKEYAFECNSHEYILRCSPPFVAGKGS